MRTLDELLALSPDVRDADSTEVVVKKYAHTDKIPTTECAECNMEEIGVLQSYSADKAERAKATPVDPSKAD
tara:strand:- start:152 stop:367 length:216 start_codon:yes stop_codon:yes gene_type:complete